MSTNRMSFSNRPLRRAACALVVAAAAALPAWAHHGWAWAEEGNSELSGVVVAAKLGNPHGELTVDVGGVQWVVEVGQPWRNERAGLTDDIFSIGRMITVHGHRSAKKGERLVKAERVVIDGKSHNLYPDRES